MSDNRAGGTEPLGLERAASLLGNFDESGLHRNDGATKREQRPEANEPEDNAEDEGLLAAADKLQEAEEQDEPEGDEEPDDAEAESEEDDAEEEGDEETDDTEEDTDEESEQQDATLDDDSEVDVDGKPVKLSELRDGYLRQSDYTRKTQAIAEERKSLEGQKAEIERARGSYMERLQVLDQFLQKSKPYDDEALDKLAEEDPAKYTRAVRENEKHQAALNAIQQEMQTTFEQRQKEYAEVRRKAAEEGRQRLPEVIPEWRNPEVMKREAGEVAQYLKSWNRSDEEIAGITDPSIIAMVRDSMLYRRAQRAKQALPAKKAKPKPKPAPKTKPAKANAAKDPGHQKQQKLKKLRADVKKSGQQGGSRTQRFNSAARLISEMDL